MQHNQTKSQNKSNKYEGSFYMWHDKRGLVVIKFIRSIYNVADVLTKPIPADQHEVLTEIVLTGHKENHPEQWVEQVLIINDEQELVIIANSEYLGRKDF